MKKKNKRRTPICPKCGSIKVEADRKKGVCKNCGHCQPIQAFMMHVDGPYPKDGRPRGFGGQILPTPRDE